MTSGVRVYFHWAARTQNDHTDLLLSAHLPFVPGWLHRPLRACALVVGSRGAARGQRHRGGPGRREGSLKASSSDSRSCFRNLWGGPISGGRRDVCFLVNVTPRPEEAWKR